MRNNKVENNNNKKSIRQTKFPRLHVQSMPHFFRFIILPKMSRMCRNYMSREIQIVTNLKKKGHYIEITGRIPQTRKERIVFNCSENCSRGGGLKIISLKTLYFILCVCVLHVEYTHHITLNLYLHWPSVLPSFFFR